MDLEFYIFLSKIIDRSYFIKNKNEKTQIVRDALSKMNLTKHNSNPEKEDFANDRDLASQLGVSKTTVWNVRQSLIKQAEDYDIVYAWRWSGDNTCAKIGVSTLSLFRLVWFQHIILQMI